MDWKIKMTKEEIIEMVREAGGYSPEKYPDEWRLDVDDLSRFAKLIAEKEREECAKIFDDAKGTGRIASCREAADAIRARGQE